MPRLFLDCVARALVARAPRPLLLHEPLSETVCDVADMAMALWLNGEPHLDRRRLALEKLAQANEVMARQLATAFPGAISELHRPLLAYLHHLPLVVRRSLSRPEDPAGRSVPLDMPLEEGRHLLPFLPLRAPRFQPGDRPLRETDLQLEQLLGIGGFGEVWMARRVEAIFEPAVALKFCLEQDAARVLQHEMAVLEQVMKQGGHSGVVALRRAHLNADPPCLEYEYIDGEDLGRHFATWQPSPAERQSRGLALMLQLAQIVATAHRRNPPVVHRDLKPANILIQPTATGPRVRVTDFGIGGLATRQARTQTRTQGSQDAHLLTRLSGAYTPLYASQEQMKGEAPDPRDDVHALGVICYQILLGDLQAKPTPDWDLRLQERDVPSEVIALVGRCLASSKRRLASAVLLAEELGRLTSLPAPGSIVERTEDAEETQDQPEPTSRFYQNILTFGIAYGLALQGLARGWLRTNLHQPTRSLARWWRRLWKTSTGAAWGIDIGRCSLKALRLQGGEDRPQATAYDLVEYPQGLDQPGANAEALIHDALRTFLERNSLEGATLAIAVPGQYSLARFFTLPPLEENDLGDYMQFEARQQIPFPLEEVVWDHQKIHPGTISDGYMIDAVVGLFAAKRDIIARRQKWLGRFALEADIVQLAPLALCNFLAHDVVGADPALSSKENNTCIACLDLGAAGSHFLISDGKSMIWQRSILLGGNDFTLALAKNMKLTFDQAEILKRDASRAADLRLILQAMRPVFNDLALEVERCLAYFKNGHAERNIHYLLGLGNGFRLVGLQKFLSSKLHLEVRLLEQVNRLAGKSALLK